MQIRSGDQIQLGRITLQSLLSKLTCCRYSMHCNALSLHLALPLSLVGVTKGLYDRFEHPDCIMVFCLLTFI